VLEDDAFVAVAHRIVWCTVATVDRLGRPRSRVLHPYWEQTEEGLTGWITTRPTPLKRAHLEHSPYLSCSYWDATQDAVVAECCAGWAEDLDEKEHAWGCSAPCPSRSGTTPTRSGRQARPTPTPACCGSTRGGSAWRAFRR
jgi:hypothetical protein